MQAVAKTAFMWITAIAVIPGILLLLSLPTSAQSINEPSAVMLRDRPNDDGSAVLLTFSLSGDDGTLVSAEVDIGGEWLPTSLRLRQLQTLPTVGDLPEYFGWSPQNPEHLVLIVDRFMALDDDGQLQPTGFGPNNNYEIRLVVEQDGVAVTYPAGGVTTREEWFNTVTVNNLMLCVIFAIIIMSFILAARRNPNLYIRRISGLEAVDEAIGRATEMGKPVLHLNGLDPLSTLSTIAAVNILGRIAKRVANYDSELLVPCFDPVVMTVSQEVVKNAYLEAGRPDAYREDHIYFVTDQQFSYVATVCGLMVREKPAANFMLGYFYAESLLLAETGFTSGAIQIAGTDALSQLPFFITTCDYTLIGEELYAASAYLSREPMLLGSLKGQDVGKAFVMVMIIVGSILSTFGVDWLTRLLTPMV
jgi:hypothetical protein